MMSEAIIEAAVEYELDGRTFESIMLTRGGAGTAETLMLLVPNFTGMNPLALDRGRQFVEDVRDVFVVDIYGTDTRPRDFADAMAAMQPLEAQPREVRRRMNEALAIARDRFRLRHGRLPTRTAAIGFCFGGGNVLELARSGAELDAIVSIHGSLLTSQPAEKGSIRAPILIAHGAADPVVPKAHCDAIERELTEAGATWSMLLFGGVLHGYTDEHIAGNEMSAFDAYATFQTYRMLNDFIANTDLL